MTTMNCWKVLEADGYYRSFIEKNKRPDGREWMKERPVTVKVGSISTADGSATVRLGNTSVVCGIKAEIAVPTLRRPDEGFIVPNVEMYPCCSALVKPGPPGEKAIVTNKFLADIIKSSAMIDLKSLCVVANKVVWCLYCDVVCLDYDGNLTDASLLALTAALSDTVLPLVTWDPDYETIKVSSEKTERILVKAVPTATTFTLYNSEIHLLDPTAEDEEECNGAVTFVLQSDDTLCSVQKSGGEFLPSETMQSLLAVAKKRHKDLLKTVQDAVKSETSK